MSKRSTPTSSSEVLSDLAKVDAHVIQPHEYDELPELTDEMVARSDLYANGQMIRRGRPKLDAPKKAVTMRLDADVADRLRASGKGWQTRLNAKIRDWLASA